MYIQVYTYRYTWIRYVYLFTLVGVYVGDASPADQDIFIVEHYAFVALCGGLICSCTCWHSTLWDLQSLVQVLELIMNICCTATSFSLSKSYMCSRKDMYFMQCFVVDGAKWQPRHGLLPDVLEDITWWTRSMGFVLCISYVYVIYVC